MAVVVAVVVQAVLPRAQSPPQRTPGSEWRGLTRQCCLLLLQEPARQVPAPAAAHVTDAYALGMAVLLQPKILLYSSHMLARWWQAQRLPFSITDLFLD